MDESVIDAFGLLRGGILINEPFFKMNWRWRNLTPDTWKVGVLHSYIYPN